PHTRPASQASEIDEVVPTKAHTRETPNELHQQGPPAKNQPAPPWKTCAPATWCRVWGEEAAGAGTFAQGTGPEVAAPATSHWCVPFDWSPLVGGRMRLKRPSLSSWVC
ncbi:hypothetical protein, partial [Streptomyces sp. SP18CM02]|uniref:hypothetical protein n=1 Tax=Streptomyces sp. SP18CM02 TaxID=2758571 RepID=UPI00168AA294